MRTPHATNGAWRGNRAHAPTARTFFGAPASTAIWMFPGKDGDHRGRGRPSARPSGPRVRRQEERTRRRLGHSTGVHPEPRASQPGRNQLDVQSRRYEMDQAAEQQQAGQSQPGPSGPWIFEAFYGVFDGLLNGHS